MADLIQTGEWESGMALQVSVSSFMAVRRRESGVGGCVQGTMRGASGEVAGVKRKGTLRAIKFMKRLADANMSSR